MNAESSMKILALEFSSERRSVAVADSASGTCSILDARSGAGGRNMRAFDLIETTLGNSSVSRREIECIAVGLGPGSYTGVRAAIAIAQGWQLASGVKLVGVNSIEAIAFRLAADGERGTFGIVVNAQRGEFYLGVFEIASGRHRPQEPLRIVPGEQVRARQEGGLIVVGPHADRLTPTARPTFPDATSIAALGGKATTFLAGEHLEPIYLRPTDFVKAPPPRFTP